MHIGPIGQESDSQIGGQQFEFPLNRNYTNFNMGLRGSSLHWSGDLCLNDLDQFYGCRPSFLDLNRTDVLITKGPEIGL